MSRNIIDERSLFRLGSWLSDNKLKLVCSESMTTGFLSSTFGLEVCSGDYYLCSVVCYENERKVIRYLSFIDRNAFSRITRGNFSDVARSAESGAIFGCIPQHNRTCV